jgi:hypothetical protein
MVLYGAGWRFHVLNIYIGMVSRDSAVPTSKVSSSQVFRLTLPPPTGGRSEEGGEEGFFKKLLSFSTKLGLLNLVLIATQLFIIKREKISNVGKICFILSSPQTIRKL